jgi:hypothetical protein
MKNSLNATHIIVCVMRIEEVTNISIKDENIYKSCCLHLLINLMFIEDAKEVEIDDDYFCGICGDSTTTNRHCSNGP